MKDLVALLIAMLPPLAAVLGGLGVVAYTISITENANVIWAIWFVIFLAYVVYPHGLSIQQGLDKPDEIR